MRYSATLRHLNTINNLENIPQELKTSNTEKQQTFDKQWGKFKNHSKLLSGINRSEQKSMSTFQSQPLFLPGVLYNSIY